MMSLSSLVTKTIPTTFVQLNLNWLLELGKMITRGFLD